MSWNLTTPNNRISGTRKFARQHCPATRVCSRALSFMRPNQQTTNTMDLQDTIKQSIDLLQRGEALALELNPKQGYYLAFSGGKDSQVLLALAKMAGVKFHAEYSVTGNDAPENLYYLREHYPEVHWAHPKKKFFALVKDKGLPTINRRFCCERLKEGLGKGEAVLTGVRAEESRKRASYGAIEIFSRRVEHRGKERAKDTQWLAQLEHECVKGQDRVMIRPMLHWKQEEVWAFIIQNGMPVNPLYKMHGRVGCMFCPFASARDIATYRKEYPRFEAALIRALQCFWDKYPQHMLPNVEYLLHWWMTKRTVEEYKRVMGLEQEWY